MKTIALQALAERLCAMERGHVADSQASQSIATGWADVDAILGAVPPQPPPTTLPRSPGSDAPATLGTLAPGGLATGAIHEWCGLADREGEPLPTWSPPLCLLMHLVRRTLEQRPGQAIWIGRDIWPYPLALASAAAGLLERCVFVDVSAAERAPVATAASRTTSRHAPKREMARLWAADMALRCGAVGVVVLDATGLSMAGTRRLQLAAEGGGALGLIVRPPQESASLSAAQTRWQVRVEPSAEDQPRWRISLLRAKAGVLRTSHGSPRDFLLEWSRATTDVVCLPADVAGGPGAKTPAQGNGGRAVADDRHTPHRDPRQRQAG